MSSIIHNYSFTISPYHGQTQAHTVRQLREGKDQKLSNVYKHESGMTKPCVAVWRKRERELVEVEGGLAIFSWTELYWNQEVMGTFPFLLRS